jgi:hypothetical protein
MEGACSTYGGEERLLQGFVGILEEKRPLGRLRHRGEENIKMDPQEVGGEAWIGLMWWALVNVLMILWVP